VTDQSEKILAKCAFDSDNSPDVDEINETFVMPLGLDELYGLQKGIEAGGGFENARLLPIIQALLTECENLSAVLKEYKSEDWNSDATLPSPAEEALRDHAAAMKGLAE
jgi:hypothetical protein